MAVSYSKGIKISIHALLAESDALLLMAHLVGRKFLSTLSLRRATIALFDFPIVPVISIHALLAESDYDTSSLMQCQVKFLSTLSLRRATVAPLLAVGRTGISIHALLAESDCYSLRHSAQDRHFYPRSPCGERHVKVRMICTSINFYPRSPCGERQLTPLIKFFQGTFLSTLSLRRATTSEYDKMQGNPFLSTLSLRRATLAGPSGPAFLFNFYPRSPCGERHQILDDMSGATRHFYPRSPCGERLRQNQHRRKRKDISIHALLAESDQANAVDQILPGHISIHALLAESDRRRASESIGTLHFYPRSPCGERQPTATRNNKNNVFLSTLSLRRATLGNAVVVRRTSNFYPRSPCGERPVAKRTTDIRPPFLSTLSLRRATTDFSDRFPLPSISIHALLAESDSISAQNCGALLRI